MADEYNKGVGKAIPIDQARLWIKTYKDKTPKGIFAHFCGSDIIEQILAQPDCVGIRIHYALDANGVQQLILVGTRADGDNIWPSDIGASYADGIVADELWPCPIKCNTN